MIHLKQSDNLKKLFEFIWNYVNVYGPKVFPIEGSPP